MSSAAGYPVTTAIRFLREKKIPFEPCLYTYEERGGTAAASAALRVDEHAVIKTLVMEDDTGRAFIVLEHGDCEVSTKGLARLMRVKGVCPCEAATASRHTGYLTGGTSPFGTREPLPVYAEATIFSLPRIFINGGKRGFLLAMDPAHIRTSLQVTEVNVAIPRSPKPAGTLS